MNGDGERRNRGGEEMHGGRREDEWGGEGMNGDEERMNGDVRGDECGVGMGMKGGGGSTVNAKYRSDHRDVCVCVCDVWCVTVMHYTKVHDMYIV
jgi:hypothetical protein